MTSKSFVVSRCLFTNYSDVRLIGQSVLQDSTGSSETHFAVSVAVTLGYETDIDTKKVLEISWLTGALENPGNQIVCLYVVVCHAHDPGNTMKSQIVLVSI